MAFKQPYSVCFLHILLLLPCSIFAQTHISLGSSLTAQNDNSSWPSPSGDFAFGFQKIGEDGFLLAIWFNKVKERTIAWSANGNNLVSEGSKVELTSDGKFMLNDATGKQIWMAESSGTGVAYAAMLDTGNFVLVDHKSINLWESFDVPTDTILPTQILNINSTLYARFSASNYSKGRFFFELQFDGNLMLCTTFFPLDSANFAYWSTQTNVGNTGFQVIFNQSGSIYLTGKNGSILKTFLSNSVSVQDFYHRATLEYDGVLRHYVYPKKTSQPIMTWSSQSFEPSNICLRIGDIGVGACGFNSFCRLDDQGPICECPDGYAFIDPNDLLKGCKQNFVPQSCDEASPEMDMFDFQDIEGTDWPDSNYEKFKPVTEDWCRQTCLGDCFCDVFYYENNVCWKKRIPLSNGRMDPSFGGKAHIKIRKNNSTLKPGGTNTKKNSSTLIFIGTVLLCSLGFLSFLLPFITYMVVSRIYSRKGKVSQHFPSFEEVNLKCFTYEELHEATEGFKEEIGRGAFATVFKGVLAFDDVQCVAVKRLNTMVGETECEFKAEVSAIGRTNHRNLVKLIGFCNEGENRLLVYEFMSNGSLASFLFRESRPNWYSRSLIALGVAKGLLYLHEECSSQIIHCDIKPQNILLDASFTGRISDFGLAKLLRTDQTRTTTGIRGTRGYVATEWFKNIPITVKVDVYSYGILLLEIISCRKHFEENAEDEDQMILADWAYDCYKQNKLYLLLGSDHEAINDITNVEQFVMIALWCIQEDLSLRPSMKKVTLMLEGIIKVSAPPDPSSLATSN
ncbi:G-type lectin S-receptor-like serine/threonine-protein kinase LECRK1 [Rosa rugosa]|uniref:G-type lectin S-receptor-like serine/threonine-protein kinase LECRK1 n=1 Tax=Rosa rugosa TaxID=74645 RepID=UPI002B417E67|nr:G-type lectin S-receptor-like serine/threonine-protein kinase LECRK1 [Rosa rugosa]